VFSQTYFVVCWEDLIFSALSLPLALEREGEGRFSTVLAALICFLLEMIG
jgi:hypothetical protein